MRLITLCALVALSFSTSAQYQRGRADKLFFSQSLFIKVAPLQLFDPKGAVLPIALEYGFGDTWGIQGEFAVPFFNTMQFGEKRGHPGKSKKITSDYRFGLELRKYFAVVDYRRGFFALEGFYRMQNADMTDDYFIAMRGGGSFSYASAEIVKRSAGVAGCIGVSHQLARGAYLELMSGLGCNFFNVEFRDLKGEKYDGDSDAFFFPLFSQDDHINGTGNRLYVSGRIRFSFLLSSGQNKRYRL